MEAEGNQAEGAESCARLPFEAAMHRACRRRGLTLEEALLEITLAGASVSRVQPLHAQILDLVDDQQAQGVV
jgi:hypothetical protein